MQIVAVNDQVAIEGNRTNSLIIVRDQRTEWYGKVVVVDEFLPLEVQLGHRRSIFGRMVVFGLPPLRLQMG